VETDEVVAADVPALTEREQHPREIPYGLVVGSPPELRFVPAGTAQVEVEDLRGAAGLHEAAHLFDHCGKGGQFGQGVEQVALEPKPLRAEPVVVRFWRGQGGRPSMA
jgi:hypothetical protein